MQVATGKVVNGKVVIENLSLPAATLVAVFADGAGAGAGAEAEAEADAAVRRSPAADAELVEALDDADRDEGNSAEEVFERLRKYG